MAIRGRRKLSSDQKAAEGNRSKEKIVPTLKLSDRDLICPTTVLEDPVQRHYWDFYLSHDEYGLLAAIDTNLLTQLCQHSAYRDRFARSIAEYLNDGDAPDIVLVNAHAKQSEMVRKNLAEMGITPSARNRMAAPEVKDSDPAAQYLD